VISPAAAWRAAEQAASALGPEADLLARIDPADLADDRMNERTRLHRHGAAHPCVGLPMSTLQPGRTYRRLRACLVPLRDCPL